jgi:hypothetical protein
MADHHFNYGSYRKHHVLSHYHPVEKYPTFVNTIDRVIASVHALVMTVLQKDKSNTALGNTRHGQIFRQNVMATTTANRCCCCDFIYCLGAVGNHLSPVQNVSALLKHSIMAQGFFAV